MDEERAMNYNWNGQEAGDSGDYKKAIRYFDLAIDENPYFKDAWFNKGITFIMMDEYFAAIESFHEVIKLDPFYAEAYAYEGASNYYLKEYIEAIKMCEKAISLDKYNSSAWFYLGLAKFAWLENKDAINAFQTFIEIGDFSIHPRADAVKVLELATIAQKAYGSRYK